MEELRYGPSYDMEIAELELQQEEEVDSLSDQPSLRLAKHTLTHGMLLAAVFIIDHGLCVQGMTI